jgi:hypothetical protein
MGFTDTISSRIMTVEAVSQDEIHSKKSRYREALTIEKSTRPTSLPA